MSPKDQQLHPLRAAVSLKKGWSKGQRDHGRAWAQYVGSGGECGLCGWVLGGMARDDEGAQ